MTYDLNEVACANSAPDKIVLLQRSGDKGVDKD
jgi:hypothetical protein